MFLKPTRIIMQCPDNTTEWCRKENRFLWMRRAIQNSSVQAKRSAYWMIFSNSAICVMTMN